MSFIQSRPPSGKRAPFHLLSVWMGLMHTTLPHIANKRNTHRKMLTSKSTDWPYNRQTNLYREKCQLCYKLNFIYTCTIPTREYIYIQNKNLLYQGVVRSLHSCSILHVLANRLVKCFTVHSCIPRVQPKQNLPESLYHMDIQCTITYARVRN